MIPIGINAKPSKFPWVTVLVIIFLTSSHFATSEQTKNYHSERKRTLRKAKLPTLVSRFLRPSCTEYLSQDKNFLKKAPLGMQKSTYVEHTCVKFCINFAESLWQESHDVNKAFKDLDRKMLKGLIKHSSAKLVDLYKDFDHQIMKHTRTEKEKEYLYWAKKRLAHIATQKELPTKQSLSTKSISKVAIMHANWGHLIGNLVTFCAAAIFVELRIGSILFLFILMGLSFAVSLISITITPQSSDLLNPLFVGFSGVVSAVLGMYAVLFHRHKTNFVTLFLFIPMVVAIPTAFSICMFFVSSDVIRAFSSGIGIANDSVHYQAHLTGFFFGLGLGYVLKKLIKLRPFSLSPKEDQLIDTYSKQRSFSKRTQIMLLCIRCNPENLAIRLRYFWDLAGYCRALKKSQKLSKERIPEEIVQEQLQNTMRLCVERRSLGRLASVLDRYPIEFPLFQYTAKLGQKELLKLIRYSMEEQHHMLNIQLTEAYARQYHPATNNISQLMSFIKLRAAQQGFQDTLHQFCQTHTQTRISKTFSHLIQGKALSKAAGSGYDQSHISPLPALTVVKNVEEETRIIPKATLLQRAVSLWLDWQILTPAFYLWGLFGKWVDQFLQTDGFGEIFVIGFCLLTYVLYFCSPTSRSGQTIGKSVVGIRVVRRSAPGSVSIGQTLLREIVAKPLVLVLIIAPLVLFQSMPFVATGLIFFLPALFFYLLKKYKDLPWDFFSSTEVIRYKRPEDLFTMMKQTKNTKF